MGTYEGWSNYETWCVNLWVSNEEGTYHAAVEMAEGRDGDAPYGLAESFKTWVTGELLPDLGSSLASDLLSAAVSEVDWTEIAEHWIADCPLASDDDDADAVS
jgi:prophage antirepressor-like protein